VRRRRFWLLTLVALAVAVGGNTAFAISSSAGSGLVSARAAALSGIADAVPVNSSTQLVATLGNEVALVQNGRVTARQKLDATVGGIATAPDGSTFYAGTSLGTVYTLDSGLHPTSTRHVADAVAGYHADMHVSAGEALKRSASYGAQEATHA